MNSLAQESKKTNFQGDTQWNNGKFRQWGSYVYYWTSHFAGDEFGI